MERAVLMIKAEQRAKLTDLAGRARVSAAEIHRRAIDAYNPEASKDDDLEQLAEIALQSHKTATQAIKAARGAVKESLLYFSKKRKKNEC